MSGSLKTSSSALRQNEKMRSSKNKIFILLFAILTFYPEFVYPDEVTLSTSVDKSEITIGDKITYTLKITYEKGIEVTLPSPGKNLGQFDILDYNEPPPTEEDGKVIKIIEYIISNYAVGEYKIPPIKIEYQPQNGETRELATDEIQITVKSVVKPEEQDIRDLKDVVDIRPDLSVYYKLGTGILILGIIIFLIIYYIRYRKRLKGKRIEEEAAPKYPPHEEAFMALKALEGRGLVQKGRIKEFYLEFSEIVRRYISRRYEIDAMEMTTYELMESFKEISIAPENLELLTEILEESDLVKYAKYRPPDENIKLTLQKGYDFVDKTKKIVILETPQPEAAVKD